MSCNSIRLSADLTKEEEFHLPGYNTVYSVKNDLTFLRNMSPPSSGPKNK
jgi:hypothetical protein